MSILGTKDKLMSAFSQISNNPAARRLYAAQTYRGNPDQAFQLAQGSLNQKTDNAILGKIQQAAATGQPIQPLLGQLKTPEAQRQAESIIANLERLKSEQAKTSYLNQYGEQMPPQLRDAVMNGLIPIEDAVTYLNEQNAPKPAPSGMRWNADGTALEAIPGYLDVQTQLKSAGAPQVNVNTGDTGPKFGTIPPGYMMTGDAESGYRMEPVEGSPDIKDSEKESSQAWLALDGMLSGIDNIQGTIKEVKDDSDSMSTGIIGSILKRIPTTDAYNMGKKVQTIQANLGFDKLQSMREASPTGGALGQVSERELNFLQSTVANLDPNMGEEEFDKALEKIEEHYANWKKAVTRHYTDTYGPRPQTIEDSEISDLVNKYAP